MQPQKAEAGGGTAARDGRRAYGAIALRFGGFCCFLRFRGGLGAFVRSCMPSLHTSSKKKKKAANLQLQGLELLRHYPPLSSCPLLSVQI